MKIQIKLILTITFSILATSLPAQYSTHTDIQSKKGMMVYVKFLTGQQTYIQVGNQRRPIPGELAQKRAYWRRLLAKGRKGGKPAIADSTSAVIPVAEALLITDSNLKFTHWSPVYNFIKVWGGRVEFVRNSARYEASYYWFDGKIIDLIIRPAPENNRDQRNFLSR